MKQLPLFAFLLHRVTLLVMTTVLFGACSPSYENPHILIETTLGDIEVELYPAKAPKTTAAFLKYVEAGLYKDASFYRVLKTEGVDEMSNAGFIQGGIIRTDPRRMSLLPPTEHEPTTKTGLSHTDGTISMARVEVGSARSEFFICIGDQSPLDAGRRGSVDGQGYAAFGKVFKGMKTVRRIQAQESNGDAFTKKIGIRLIRKL